MHLCLSYLFLTLLSPAFIFNLILSNCFFFFFSFASFLSLLFPVLQTSLNCFFFFLPFFFLCPLNSCISVNAPVSCLINISIFLQCSSASVTVHVCDKMLFNIFYSLFLFLSLCLLLYPFTPPLSESRIQTLPSVCVLCGILLGFLTLGGEAHTGTFWVAIEPCEIGGTHWDFLGSYSIGP